MNVFFLAPIIYPSIRLYLSINLSVAAFIYLSIGISIYLSLFGRISANLSWGKRQLELFVLI